MSSKSAVFAWIGTFIAIALAFFTYISKIPDPQPCTTVAAAVTVTCVHLSPQDSSFALRTAVRLKPYSYAGTLTTSILLAVFQLSAFYAGRHTYRKDTIQNALDELCTQCGGVPNRNRVTLFKRVDGWEALVRGGWRLRWRWLSKDRRQKLGRLTRVEWFSPYLFAYVRSSHGRNPGTVVAFRVSDLRRDECEGLAGRTYFDGTCFVPDLPALRDVDRKRAGKATIEEVRRRGPNDPLRRYVARTNITTTEQMRSFNVFAKHFLGFTVQVKKGRTWGVLLLDSEEELCPFDAAAGDGGALGKVFRSHAVTLGHLLRKG